MIFLIVFQEITALVHFLQWGIPMFNVDIYNLQVHAMYSLHNIFTTNLLCIKCRSFYLSYYYLHKYFNIIIKILIF